MNRVRELLSQCPFVAILRGVRPDEVEAIGQGLVAAGFRIVEVPLNSPEPFVSIERLARVCGNDALVGAGTVLRADQVDAVASAGGRLIVTPHADSTVLRQAKLKGLVAMPGFFTPAEAFAMVAGGADALKLFPAEGSSPAALKSMRAVLPRDIPILPVGGIGADNIGPWLAAGASGFGLGSSLYKPGDAAADVIARGRRCVAAFAALAADRA